MSGRPWPSALAIVQAGKARRVESRIGAEEGERGSRRLHARRKSVLIVGSSELTRSTNFSADNLIPLCSLDVRTGSTSRYHKLQQKNSEHPGIDPLYSPVASSVRLRFDLHMRLR